MFIPEMPFGGQVTLVSMLPVVLISYRHGVRWGLVAGLGYAMIEMLLGARTVAAAFQPGYFGDGTMIVNALIMCVLDYLAAFTVLGLGGAFRSRIQNPGAALCCGSVLALSCRYVCHIASGYILFAGWAEWFFTQEGFPAWGAALVASLSPDMLGFVYSLVYNGMYMVPEILLTAAVALFLGRSKGIAVKVS
jgi:thiamine transporter